MCVRVLAFVLVLLPVIGLPAVAQRINAVGGVTMRQAQDMARRQLDTAGASGFVFLNEPETFQHYNNVLWTNQDGRSIGSLHLLSAAPLDYVEARVARLLEHYRSDCTGRYISAVRERAAEADWVGARLFAFCDNFRSSGTASVQHISVARYSNGFGLTFTTGQLFAPTGREEDQRHGDDIDRAIWTSKMFRTPPVR